jgi:hypothetical protein
VQAWEDPVCEGRDELAVEKWRSDGPRPQIADANMIKNLSESERQCWVFLGLIPTQERKMCEKWPWVLFQKFGHEPMKLLQSLAFQRASFLCFFTLALKYEYVNIFHQSSCQPYPCPLLVGKFCFIECLPTSLHRL